MCVGLLIYNNLLSRHISIPPTVFEIQGAEKSQKHPLPLILGKYCPDCSVQHLLSILSYDEHFKRISTEVRTFLRPLAHDKVFQRTVFSKYLKNRQNYRKNLLNQICRSIFTLT